MCVFKGSIYRTFGMLFVAYFLAVIAGLFLVRYLEECYVSWVTLLFGLVVFFLFLRKFGGTTVILKNNILEHYEHGKLIQTLPLTQLNYAVHQSGHPLFLAHWFEFWDETGENRYEVETSSLGYIKTKKIEKLIKPYTLNKGVQKIATIKTEKR